MTPRGWLVHPITGQRFRFDSGRLALDFAYSGGEGQYAIFETLHKPADLERWLANSDLQVTVSHATEQDLARARRLRQAIWVSAQAVAHGQPPDPADLAEINAAAAEPSLAPQIVGVGQQRWAEPVQVSQALASLARDAIDLFTGPDAARLRQCEGSNCPLLFVDTSRPGARRWCSMERCGNRAKSRAHRQRAHASRIPTQEE